MITSFMVRITDKLKPVLIRLLPIELLRQAKKMLIGRSVRKLEKGDITCFSRSSHPDGVNLIGFIRGEIGLGQSCRLIVDALKASGRDFTVFNYQQVSAMRHSDHSCDHLITDTTPYNINLIHINPYELPLAFLQLGKKTWDSRYNIGFWLWELEQFPEEWMSALKLVDEVWTPSEFASASIRKVTDKPVHTIPYPISAPTDKKYSRAQFGLPENAFLTLCMYDCNSTMERKNPMGAIVAYKKAFARDNPHVGLIVKVNNPQKEDIQKLHQELESYPNIYLMDEVMEKIQVNSLIVCADVYISLHRAEGFGLVPAEAMLLGTPVIATNWSSNTEFMNADVACMVDYQFIEIERDIGPYKKGNRWADPDVDQAGNYLRKLYENPDYRGNLAQKAQAHIAQVLSREQAAEKINRRITEIYQENSK